MARGANKTVVQENPDDSENPDEQEEIDPEQLINQVQQYDLLYNKQNKLHSRITSTEVAWQNVAEGVGSTPQKCQKKWANLRRCFRDAIAKEHLPSGSGAPRGRKKFPFISQMEFLREHMSKKTTTISNFKTDPKAPASGSSHGSNHGEEDDDDLYTGRSSSAPFSGFEKDNGMEEDSNVEDGNEEDGNEEDGNEGSNEDDDREVDGTGGNPLDTSFLQALSPVQPLIPLSDGEQSRRREAQDESTARAKTPRPKRNAKRESSSGSEQQERKRRRLRADSDEENAVPKSMNRKRRMAGNVALNENRAGRNSANRVRRAKNAVPTDRSPNSAIRDRRGTAAASTGRINASNLASQGRRKENKDKRSSSDSGEPIRPRKKVMRKNRTKKTTPKTFLSSDTEDEANEMFRCITNAAESVTHRNKDRSNVDGIVKGFVTMEKHMLMKINEDSRLEYIKDATSKLTELVAREVHIETAKARPHDPFGLKSF